MRIFNRSTFLLHLRRTIKFNQKGFFVVPISSPSPGDNFSNDIVRDVKHCIVIVLLIGTLILQLGGTIQNFASYMIIEEQYTSQGHIKIAHLLETTVVDSNL